MTATPRGWFAQQHEGPRPPVEPCQLAPLFLEPIPRDPDRCPEPSCDRPAMPPHEHDRSET